MEAINVYCDMMTDERKWMTSSILQACYIMIKYTLFSFLEDGKCGELSVESVTSFLTGCTTLPPGRLGKDSRCSLHW